MKNLQLRSRQFLSSLLLVSAILLGNTPLRAQNVLIPDNTLPGEASQVGTDLSRTWNSPTDVITGGAVRGNNLFHSFDTFNVGDGFAAYFRSPANIQNILTRITGDNASQIFGTLGTYGNSQPNLFLINPHGIIFGPHARLDIGASFIATTANAIAFGDQVFSASNPTAPAPTLTVNPSAFLFNQIASQPQNSITVQGAILAVPDGHSLLLVGGTVSPTPEQTGTIKLESFFEFSPDDGAIFYTPNLIANQGRAEITGSNSPGRITLTQTDNLFSLTVPDTLSRPDIILENAGIFEEGGTLKLDGNHLQIQDSSLSTLSAGQISGDIQLVAQKNIDVTASRFEASHYGTSDLEGYSGQISLTAEQEIHVEHSEFYNHFSGNGFAQDITFKAQSISLKDSHLNTSLSGRGHSGDINFQALDKVEIFNTGLLLSTGRGNIAPTSIGSVNIHANSINIENVIINSTNYGEGNSGKIRLQADQDITLQNSQLDNRIWGAGVGQDITLKAPEIKIIGNYPAEIIPILSSETTGAGLGGNINIESEHFTMTGAYIYTESYGLGKAGSVNIKSRFVGLADADLQSSNHDWGDGGDINITSDQLLLSDNAKLDASVGRWSFGKGGSINLDITGDIILTGVPSPPYIETTRITVNVEPSSHGPSGDINVKAGSLILKQGAILNASTTADGHAGNINIRASLVDISGSVAKNGLPSGLFVSTKSDAPAGNIQVNATDFRLSEGAILSARSLANGQGGNITINTTNFTALGGGQLVTMSFGAGDAGNITVTATDYLTIEGSDRNYQDRIAKFPGALSDETLTNNITETGAQSGLYAGTFGSGRAGSITLNARQLTLQQGGQATTSTSGTGEAGSITVNATDQILLNGVDTPSQKPSGLFANTTADSTGQGGQIQVSTSEFIGQQGAGISVSSQGQGAGGKLQLRVDQLSLSQGGFLNAAIASGIGDAGEIVIQANDGVTLDQGLIQSTTGANSLGNGGNITLHAPTLQLQNRSVISSSTNGQGHAGNISLHTNTLTLQDGGRVETSTSNAGQAGTITVNATDQILLSGVDPWTQAPSGLFASTTEQSTGAGGSILVDPPQVTIQNGAGISVNSQGSGNGGNLFLEATNLTLDHGGFLSASTASGEGGSIDLRVQNLLTLRHQSLISATAGGTGNGGNLNIQAGFILAPPAENSDIIANAFRGRGGQIQISTQAIFGPEYRSALTEQSDITASSEFGVNGVVNINTPAVDPSQGVVALPTNVIDASNLVSQGCNASPSALGRFVATGRGGLPPSPSNGVSSEAVWEDARVAESVTRSQSERDWVPAQGWVIQDQAVMLTARPCF